MHQQCPYKLRGNNYERKKARFNNHACDTPTHPDLPPNQIISKNLKGHRSYRMQKNVSMDGRQAKCYIP